MCGFFFALLLHKVKIGNAGTVTISSHCWETAKASTTANGMARTLLMGLFDVDVLLKSNVKGGASKVDPSAERRQPLDPVKLQALLGNSCLFTVFFFKYSIPARWGYFHSGYPACVTDGVSQGIAEDGETNHCYSVLQMLFWTSFPRPRKAMSKNPSTVESASYDTRWSRRVWSHKKISHFVFLFCSAPSEESGWNIKVDLFFSFHGSHRSFKVFLFIF